MSFFAGVLIFVLIVNCAVLILLVLMQLPKKDAGAGLAFGGGAADALFGAGSGNFLTQATRYSIIAFCVLALLLGWVEGKINSSGDVSAFTKGVQQRQQTQSPVVPPSTMPTTTLPPAVPATNSLLSVPVSAPAASNAPAAPVK